MISKHEQEMRKPLPIEVLFNSYSKNVHKDIGTGRVVKSNKKRDK